MSEEEVIDDNLVLTTRDNPYNPKIEYDKWRQWDNDNGYFTEEYLARMIDIENNIDYVDDIDDYELMLEIINKAMVSIIEDDESDIYTLV